MVVKEPQNPTAKNNEYFASSFSSIKLIKNKIHEIIHEKKEGVFKVNDEKISIKANILLPYDWGKEINL